MLNRSYTITANIEVPQDGGDGMIVTEGGRFGGYGLYVLKGKPVFVYNFLDLERFRWEGQQALTPGKHTLTFDFKYDGPGFGRGGTGSLKVDNNEVATKQMAHTIPFLMAIDETFDVGVDTRTPVDDKDYRVPFPFTGTIHKLTIKLEPETIAIGTAGGNDGDEALIYYATDVARSTCTRASLKHAPPPMSVSESGTSALVV